MKSPFPGMDPYLERYWGDVHQSLITYSRDMLQEQLPPNLRARSEERVLLETDADFVRTYYPDVYVVERPGVTRTANEAQGDVAVAEPLVVPLGNEVEVTQGYIEIIDAASGNRVVTTIEFLSPSNKLPGQSRDRYLQRQKDCRYAKVNLVEIDLTRTGERQFLWTRELVPDWYVTTYQANVFRASTNSSEVYRIPLEKPLPTINVPLRPTDEDVRLELQPLIEMCYRNGRYDDIDYRVDPVPPLDERDARWTDELLRSQKRRGQR